MAAHLTRDVLLAATKLPEETIDVPELGGTVTVRGLTGIQRDQYERSLLKGRGKKQRVNTDGARAKLVALSVVDATGARLFSDEDIPTLGKMRADILDRLYSAACRLSGLTDADLDDLGEDSEQSHSDGS